MQNKKRDFCGARLRFCCPRHSHFHLTFREQSPLCMLLSGCCADPCAIVCCQESLRTGWADRRGNSLWPSGARTQDMQSRQRMCGLFIQASHSLRLLSSVQTAKRASCPTPMWAVCILATPHIFTLPHTSPRPALRAAENMAHMPGLAKNAAGQVRSLPSAVYICKATQSNQSRSRALRSSSSSCLLLQAPPL